MFQTIPTAEPFLFPGNQTGILLTHGFTGSPKELRWMGEYLHRQGYTVLGIRLAGHATRPEDMIHLHWQEWLLSVEDGYRLLASCSERIFLAGLSMGAVLSLTFAAAAPVQGVIAISTPFDLPEDPRLRILKPLSCIIRFVPKGRGGPGQGWFGDAWKQHVAYPRYPVRPIGELNRLLGVMRERLPGVKAPVLLISSRDDEAFIREGMPKIHARLGSADKQMMWIAGSGHVITEEPQRTAVFAAAADFIRRVSRPA